MKVNKPSLVGAVFFAVVAFLFLAPFVGALADTWIPHGTADGEAIHAKREQRDGLVSLIGCGGGFLLAVLAAFVWRAPATIRFQFAFFSGLSLMGFTFAFIRKQQALAL